MSHRSSFIAALSDDLIIINALWFIVFTFLTAAFSVTSYSTLD